MRLTANRHSGRRFGCALLLAALVMTSAPGGALAEPSNERIEQKRSEAQQARERLEDLAADLEERTEEYLEAKHALDETRSRIRTIEAELAIAEADVAEAEDRLSQRAVAMYRNGRLDLISVFVGVGSFNDFAARLELLRRVGQSDAQLVAVVRHAREHLDATRTALENRRREQQTLTRDAEQKRARVDSAVAAQKAQLKSLDSELKALIAEERERQERLARERAEAAARAAREAAEREAAARAARSADASGPRSPAAGGGSFDPSGLGSSHASVVAVARRFVNKTPYLWGGTTPAGFDCSGLVMYCYREIGINLPRTSRQQFNVGTRIPASRLDLLEPGDLVFFGREGRTDRIHHVGIYIGGGDMIHAPQSGELVSIHSLYARIERRGDYVGAVRP